MMYSFRNQTREYFYDSENNHIFDSRLNRIPAGMVCEDEPAGMRSHIVFLELTKKCNLNCVYCYQSRDAFKRQGHEASEDVKFDVLTRSLEKIWLLTKNVHLVFYGGEALLYKKLIRRIVDYCDLAMVDRGLVITYAVVTNGTLLEPKINAFFNEKKFSISISLDGDVQTMTANRFVSNLATIESSMKELHEAGLPLRIIATLQSQSISRSTQNVDYLLSLPVQSISFIPCETFCSKFNLSIQDAKIFCDVLKNKVESLMRNRQYDDLQKLTELMALLKKIDRQKRVEHRCGYGKDVFALSQEGMLFPCPSFIGDANFEIKNDQVVIYPQKAQLTCAGCLTQGLCIGHCHLANFMATKGPTSSIHARCYINKVLTQIALDVYAELYLD